MMKNLTIILASICFFYSGYFEAKAEPIFPQGCLSWFDGCNTCSVSNGQVGGCTRKFCSEKSSPYCLKLMDSPDSLVLSVPFSGSISSERKLPKPNIASDIPLNCARWFDGCNTCSVVGGKPTVCTMRECMANPSLAYCELFEHEETKISDFVESNSGSFDAAVGDTEILVEIKDKPYRDKTGIKEFSSLNSKELELYEPTVWGFIKYHLFGWLK